MEQDRRDRLRPTRLRRFRQDEEGSLVVAGLMLFMGVLLIGGLSVDIIRQDYNRLKLQSTLDSAILAAADLDQKLDPKAVVEDYFDKNGLLPQLDSVEVVEAINSRTVTATAKMDTDTLFIQAIGFDSLLSQAAGTAREDISDIEISMVLDISGSMGSYGRMAKMQDAAKSFVETVLTSQEDANSNGEISVSVVPYSTQVAVPRGILNQMTLEHAHGYSSCVDFKGSDFSTAALDVSQSRVQTGHFDPFTFSMPPRRLVCRTDAAAETTVLSRSSSDLKAQIDALTPGGNTSIDVGIKWGAALLDPSLRGAIDSMVTDGQVDDKLSGRPYGYDRNNSMKVLLVMTDGANTAQYMLRDGYRGDTLSDVWGYQKSDGSWRTSLKSEEYRDTDDDGDWWEDWWRTSWGAWDDNPDGGNNAQRLTYAELWSVMSTRYNAYYNHYARYWNYNTYMDWYYDPWTTVGTSTKNARMTSICNAVKDAGTLVFTVAFEITESNATLLRDCASSENHYFNVAGDEIVYAFNAIASTINQLRLVQ
ncbi:hypothetical protein DXV76_12765 [Rhodobacteraceae bacterium CCMM004]|nr:hypothetical protein DXV76_12765 [Rhodobacteraceae bacterium CCMM004]